MCNVVVNVMILSLPGRAGFMSQNPALATCLVRMGCCCAWHLVNWHKASHASLAASSRLFHLSHPSDTQAMNNLHVESMNRKAKEDLPICLAWVQYDDSEMHLILVDFKATHRHFNKYLTCLPMRREGTSKKSTQAWGVDVLHLFWKTSVCYYICSLMWLFVWF